MAEFPLTDGRVLAILGGYFALLQRHFAAEDMMEAVLTDDFETGFVGGMVGKGLDGLRDFLSQRAGFFDERHEVQEILARDERGVHRRGTAHLAAATHRRRLARRSADGRRVRGPQRELETAIRDP